MADNIYLLLNKVMNDVGAVKKADRNTHQNFNFRGIDAVINAVSPAFRKHGIVCFPTLLTSEYETVTVGQNRTQMGHARITVKYVFAAPDGSSLEVVVPAESMDSGDKATAKAMSVAYRTALLQTLCLPTDESDPDADSYERAPQTVTRPATTKRPAPQQSSQHDERQKQAPLRSEPQAKLIGDLLSQTDTDTQLIADNWNTTVDALTVPQAKVVIDALLKLKRGESEVVVGDDGKFRLV